MSQFLYRHYDHDGNLLYVGISLNALQRTSQHKSCSQWFPDVASISIEHFESREEALEAEKEAIYNENPKYNLYRPKPKKKTKTQDAADESRKIFINRIVDFKPLYSQDDIANALGVPSSHIKRLWEEGKLGYIVKRIVGSRYGPREVRASTGWQLIDFLENLESGAITYEDSVVLRAVGT